VYIGAY